MITYRYRDAVTMVTSYRLHCEMHRNTGEVSRAVMQGPCSIPDTPASSCALGECALRTMVTRNHMRQCGDAAPRGRTVAIDATSERSMSLCEGFRKGSRDGKMAHEAQCAHRHHSRRSTGAATVVAAATAAFLAEKRLESFNQGLQWLNSISLNSISLM